MVFSEVRYAARAEKAYPVAKSDMQSLMDDDYHYISWYRAELLEALRATPPGYILVGAQSERIIGRSMTIDDFPELPTLVPHGYKEVTRFDTLTIHEINQ